MTRKIKKDEKSEIVAGYEKQIKYFEWRIRLVRERIQKIQGQQRLS